MIDIDKEFSEDDMQLALIMQSVGASVNINTSNVSARSLQFLRGGVARQRRDIRDSNVEKKDSSTNDIFIFVDVSYTNTTISKMHCNFCSHFLGTFNDYRRVTHANAISIRYPIRGRILL
jgi:hypothetical protein